MDSTVEFIHVKFFSRPDAQIKWKAFLLKNIHTLFLKRYKGLAKSHSQTVNYHVVWGKCSQTSFKFEVCLSFMTFFNWISIPVSLHTFFLLFWWKKENSRYLWGTFVLLPVFFFSPPAINVSVSHHEHPFSTAPVLWISTFCQSDIFSFLKLYSIG